MGTVLRMVDHETPAPRSVALIGNKLSTLLLFRSKLIRAWVEHGLRVHAMVPDYDAPGKERVRGLGAEPVDLSLSRTGLNPLRDSADVLRLARVLRRLRVDAVFSYFIKPVIYGTLAARLAGVPHRFALVEGAGYAFIPGPAASHSQRLLRRLVEQLYRVSLSQAERVFLLNRDDVDLFVGRGMVNPDKVLQLDGIGVDLPDYTPSEPVIRPVTFVLVARLLAEKGIAEFIQAAGMVKAVCPETRFLVLGGLDRNPGCINATDMRRWVDQGIVEWPGEVDDVRPWLRQSSVFVLPSWREGLPRSTQEAMAMGRAVITTDAPGCRETVVPDANGYLVPVRRPRALAEAMHRFIDNPQRIIGMGRASRDIAEQRFDVNKINRRILSAMQLM